MSKSASLPTPLVFGQVPELSHGNGELTFLLMYARNSYEYPVVVRIFLSKVSRNNTRKARFPR
jgi:hypothetical protein